MSQSVGSQSIGNIRVVTETPSSVLAESRWALVALALNVSLIMAIIALQRTIVLPVDASLVQHYGGVTLEIVLLYSNVLTMKGLKHGASVIFGYALSSKRGFSLAACGFLQTSSFKKSRFAQSLSLTSPSRKLLQRISVVWVAVELLKLITPFCAIALYAESHGAFNDFSDCVYFVQDKRFIPVDRQWPTLAVEVGVAEYVFGTSLGIMRSEQTDEIKTTAIFPPALRSSLNDGDTIIGLGFTADISTECVCSTGVNASDIVTAGVDSAQVNEAMEKYHDLAGMTGITFGISAENQTLRISNILSGAAVCGGNVGARLLLPLVCSTTISNHRSAQVEVAFRTDGTSASITPDVVEMISDIGPADVDTWLLFAMTKILEGPVSAFPLPPQTPGSVSPLLWWTTPNLIAVDRAMVEAGIETMYAILFKAAIQRTYVAKATQCPRKNMLTSHMSTITIRKEGMICAMLILAVQVVVSAFSVAMFGLWLASPDPIGPAVRATREFVYFMALFSSSTLACNMCELGNGASYAIWQELDVVARIGEALHSLDMPVGQLVVDKPSMVRALKNGRKYM
ncbi:hypothetical protein DFJ73DRAFT_641146 [Zopfochytrium polystomum]|nr:hypothetical protein DFJ73DRAFT_641146 [Zopfochytrium polystomum]